MKQIIEKIVLEHITDLFHRNTSTVTPDEVTAALVELAGRMVTKADLGIVIVRDKDDPTKAVIHYAKPPTRHETAHFSSASNDDARLREYGLDGGRNWKKGDWVKFSHDAGIIDAVYHFGASPKVLLRVGSWHVDARDVIEHRTIVHHAQGNYGVEIATKGQCGICKNAWHREWRDLYTTDRAAAEQIFAEW